MAVGRSNIGRVSRGSIEFNMSDLSDNNRIPLTMWFDETIITGKDKVIQDGLDNIYEYEYIWSIGAELNIARNSNSACGSASSCMVQGGNTSGSTTAENTESYNGAIWILNDILLYASTSNNDAIGNINNCMITRKYSNSIYKYNGIEWKMDSIARNINRGGSHTITGSLNNCILAGGQDNLDTEIYNGYIWAINGQSNISRYGLSSVGTTINCMIQGGASSMKTTESYNGYIWVIDSNKFNTDKYRITSTGIINNCTTQAGTGSNGNATESYNGAIWKIDRNRLNANRYDHSATGTNTNCMVQCGVIDSIQQSTSTEILKRSTIRSIYNNAVELIHYTPTRIMDNKGTYDIESKLMVINDPSNQFPGSTDPSSLSINSATIVHNIVNLGNLNVNVRQNACGGSPKSAIISGVNSAFALVTQTYNSNACKTVDTVANSSILEMCGSGIYNSFTTISNTTAYLWKYHITKFNGINWSFDSVYYSNANNIIDATGNLNGLSILQNNTTEWGYYNGEKFIKSSAVLTTSPLYGKISGNINNLLALIQTSNAFIGNIYNGNTMKVTSAPIVTTQNPLGAMFKTDGNYTAIANNCNITEYNSGIDLWSISKSYNPVTNTQFSGSSNGTDGFYNTKTGTASSQDYSTYLEGFVNPINMAIDNHKNDIGKLYFSKPIQNEWVKNTIDLNKINGGVISLVDKNQTDDDIFTGQVTEPINIKFPRAKTLEATIKYESEGIWETSKQLPVALAYASSVGSSLVNQTVIGGYTGSYLSTIYNFNGNIWASAQALPVTMKDQASCGLYYSCIISGGYNGSYLNTTYTFNGNTSRVNGATLPSTLSRHAMVGVYNAAKTVGGFNGSVRNYSYLWNGSAWSTASSFSISTYYAGASGNTNSMFVTGGFNTYNYSMHWNGSYWRTKEYTLEKKEEHAQTGSGTFANIAGGKTNNIDYSDTSYIYDNDKWKVNPCLMNVGRRYKPASNINGSANNMTAVGGYNGSYSNITEVFSKEYKDIPVKVKVNLPVSFKGFGDVNLEINPYDNIGDGCWYMGPKMLSGISQGCMLGNITGNMNMACGGFISSNTTTNISLFTGSTWINGTGNMPSSDGANDGTGNINNAMIAGGTNYPLYTRRYNGNTWTNTSNMIIGVKQFRIEGGVNSALLVSGISSSSSTMIVNVAFYNGTVWRNNGNCIAGNSNYGSVGNSTNFLMFGGSGLSTGGFHMYNGYTWNIGSYTNVKRSYCAANGTANNSVIFGAADNSVTEKYNGYTFNIVCNMNIIRSEAFNSASIVSGGNNSSGSKQFTTELYNDTHKFDITSDMIDYNGNNIFTFETDKKIRPFEEIIDYENGVWTTKQYYLLKRRASPAMIGSVNQFMIIGGINDTDVTCDICNNEVWSAGINMLQTARGYVQNHAIGLYNAGLMAGGQSNGTVIALTEKFNGSVWSTTGNLSSARYKLAMNGIQNNALAIGGSNSIITQLFNGSTWAAKANTLSIKNNATSNGTPNACNIIGGINPNDAADNSVHSFNGSVWKYGFTLPYKLAYATSIGSQIFSMTIGGENGGSNISTSKSFIIFGDGFKINNAAEMPVSKSGNSSIGNIANAVTAGGNHASDTVLEWKANKKYYRQGPGMITVGNLQYYNSDIDEQDIFYDINPHRNASVYANAVSQTKLSMSMKWYNESSFTYITGQNPASIQKTVGSNNTIKASVLVHATGFRQSIPIPSDLIVGGGLTEIKDSDNFSFTVKNLTPFYQISQSAKYSRFIITINSNFFKAKDIDWDWKIVGISNYDDMIYFYDDPLCPIKELSEDKAVINIDVSKAIIGLNSIISINAITPINDTFNISSMRIYTDY